MRRKPAAYFYLSFAFPLAFFIPILLSLFATNQLPWFFKLSYLALPAAVLYLFLPSSKQIITGGSGRSLPLLNWIVVIILIEFTALFLFIGTNLALSNYFTDNHSTLNSHTTWLTHTTVFTLTNWGLFPVTILALASALFIKTALKQTGPHHLTHELNSSKKLHGWLIRRTGDYYLMITARCVLAIIISFAVMNLSYYIYPTYSNLHHPLPGMTTAAIILVILSLKQSENLYQSIQSKKVAPAKHLLVLLILVTALVILFSAAIHHFILPNESNWLAKWKTLPLIHQATSKTVIQLFCFSWWLVLLPILSSFICYFSNGKSIRSMIMVTLIPGIILWLFSTLFPTQLQKLTSQHSLLLIGYLISLALFFYALRKPSTNQITWFGYLPNRPMKKLRVTSPRLVWLLVPAWLGIIAITGLDGVLLIGLVGSIPLLLFYAYLSIKALFGRTSKRP